MTAIAPIVGYSLVEFVAKNLAGEFLKDCYNHIKQKLSSSPNEAETDTKLEKAEPFTIAETIGRETFLLQGFPVEAAPVALVPAEIFKSIGNDSILKLEISVQSEGQTLDIRYSNPTESNRKELFIYCTSEK